MVKVKFIVGFVLLLTACTNQKEAPVLSIYDVALEHITKEQYPAEFIESTHEIKLYSLYRKELISKGQYESRLFSLRDEAIENGKTLHYYHLDTLKTLMHLDIEDLNYYLNDEFIKKNFVGISVEEMTKTLNINAPFSSSDFKSKLIQVNRYNGDLKSIYRTGATVFSFSKVLYNKSATHAVLFIDHICFMKCGSGWRVFLKKDHEKWQVVEYMETWVE